MSDGGISRTGPAPATRLVQLGRSGGLPGPVNPPVAAGSTYLQPSMAALREAEADRGRGLRTFSYGRRGGLTGAQLEDALTELEGGAGTRLASSGLAANVLVFQSLLKPGDHLVLADGVYGPVRRYCAKVLEPNGIAVSYCRADAADLADHLRPQTRLVYLETPGSVLFEIVDLPKIAEIAHEAGAHVAVDNTWGAGLLYKPLALGADISVLSATKYLSGHSDLLLGAVVAGPDLWPAVNDMAEWTGAGPSAESAHLVLRGLRTLGVRLEAQARSAATLADWFRSAPATAAIYDPAAADHPARDIFLRDFRGGAGVFSVAFANTSAVRADRFLDALTLFGIGASWGGYESLARAEDPAALRRMAEIPQDPIIRFSIGLEDPADLIADIAAASHHLGLEP